MLRFLIALALSLLVVAAIGQEKKGVKKPAAGDSQPEAKTTTTTAASAKPSPISKSTENTSTAATAEPSKHPAHAAIDYFGLLFVFVLATFIGLGVVARVSRLLHTPLMSLTNAISAIAVIGSIIVTGSDYPLPIRLMGAVALFASMTNVVSGFLITDRMLKMFKQTRTGGKP
jgi:proton-translocating NAD(P)+ transhydrogenase subunit alpha